MTPPIPPIPPNPRRETVAGYWYYGADCPACGAFQYLIYDEDQGQGAPTTNVGPPIKWRCEVCGEAALYLPSLLRLKRAGTA